MDINKLKVADLRKELQTRGLDTKGNKPVLVERLKEAIAKEEEEPEEEEDEEEVESENEASSGGENSLTYETAESANTSVREVTSATSEDRAFSVITSASTAPENNLPDDIDSQSLETNDTIASDYTLSKSQSEDVSVSEPVEKSDEVKEIPKEEELVQSQADQQEQVMPEQDDISDQQDVLSEFKDETETPKVAEENHFVKESSPVAVNEPEPDPVQQVEKVVEEMAYEEPSKDTTEVTEVIDENDTSGIQNVSNDTLPFVPSLETSEITDSSSKDKKDLSESMEQDKSTLNDESQTFDGNEETLPRTDEVEKMDTDATSEVNEQNQEAKKSEQDSADADCLWNSDEEPSAQPKESVAEASSDGVPSEEPKKRIRKSRFDQPEERKRKHSPSPSGNDYRSGAHYEGPAKIPKQDDEPSYDQDSVILSWYDSDLNLVINKENFVGAVPLTEQGFMYMWGGARSTYGFNSGKVYYDVKLLEKCPVNSYDEFEIYSFRLGWSVAYSSLQLGETSLSYGYDSSGKKCTNNTFEEYGQSFATEDVIGCLLDFESNEENVLISFAFNGTKQEVAFEVPKTSLEDKALFPHILSKNISFEVNFGDRIEAWISDESYRENFEWAAKVPLEQRIQGPKKAEEKTECEVIMMCGLPCSGKTTWVKNHVETHPEKMYNVIGIDFALNKMKVLNEPLQNYYKDAPDMLVEKCSKCVYRLIDLASVRWRNYIIDEPNVFAAIQRRKMRDFEGYTRIAIVIIPNEEEYDRMLEKWNDNTLRDTSISLIEFKENFKLPEEGDLFKNVTFVGVNKEEAEEIIKKYNKEGRDARPPRDERSYNRGFSGRDHMDRMQPYGRPPMGGFRQRWMDRGPPSSMGRGGWGQRGGMDRMPPAYRDRRNWRDSCRSPDDDRDGGYRSGGGRYQQRAMPGSRYGNSGPMMGNSRWGGGGGGGRDRDRMPPRGGGPNPLMGSMMGKPMMGYDRKGGRYGSDDGKRREEGDSDEYDRTRGIPPPGIDVDNNDDAFDDGAGSGGEDGDRKRRSRFSDSGDRRGGRGGGGYMGRGGNGGRGGGRGGSNGRSGPFPPGKGPRGGGGYRGRGPEGNNDYYGGRRGGPPGRDNRDRNQMGPRQGSSRFDKRDSSGKNDGNSQVSQSGWGMYGQGGWNQAAAANYQNWAQQYQGYNAQQMQQYWSQMQQQQQNQSGQQNQSSQQSSSGGPQNSKNSNTGSSSNTSSTAASQSASNSSSQQTSGSQSGYSTQGYNTGYGTQGYDPNTYAQYYAYCNQLAQQGWTQNAWAAYGYNYGAMAASAGGVGGLPSTSVPPPSVTGGASGSSTGGSGNQSSAVTSASNK